MLLDEVGTYLQAQGVGTLGTDLFKGDMPPDINTVIAIIETPGFGPQDQMGSGQQPGFEQPGFQILCRAPTYGVARQKADAAWKALTKVANTTLSGVAYQRIKPTQSPFLVGRDDNQRVLVNCNYQVWKVPS